MTVKRLLLAGLLAAAAAALQGCFPIVATGVGAGALMVADRRTSGAFVEDEGVEWKVQKRISDQFGSRAHVNATSYNRLVLLTGEVPDEAARAEVERIARATENVREVVNETVVAGVSSLTARSNDAFITTKVKSRFVEAARFSPNLVKVVTEGGTVFLMGLVTHEEADHGTELARTTGGVQRVVRVFELIGADEARRLDSRPPQQAPAPAK